MNTLFIINNNNNNLKSIKFHYIYVQFIFTYLYHLFNEAITKNNFNLLRLNTHYFIDGSDSQVNKKFSYESLVENNPVIETNSARSIENRQSLNKQKQTVMAGNINMEFLDSTEF